MNANKFISFKNPSDNDVHDEDMTMWRLSNE